MDVRKHSISSLEKTNYICGGPHIILLFINQTTIDGRGGGHDIIDNVNYSYYMPTG